MKTPACAMFNTPIMLKMSVRPLDSMNNSRPYTTPLRSEDTKTSIMGCYSMKEGRFASGNPRRLLAARDAGFANRSARTLHLASRGHRRRLGVDFAVGDEADLRPLEGMLHLVRHGRNEQRLQQLMIIGAHLDRAERRRHRQLLERPGDFDGVVRFRLLRRLGEHLHHGLDAPVAVFVFLAGETLFECGDRRIELGRDVLMPLAHLLYLADAGLSDRRRRAEPARVIRVPYAVIPGVLAGLDQQQ